MLKALWLTSWYPNNLDAMKGDFVQRHALAVSLFCEVNVIHLQAGHKNELQKSLEISNKTTGNLTEKILLYRINRLPLIGKIVSYLQYFRLLKMQVDQYILKHGKPDIVHVHVPMKAGIVALWIKRKFNIPFIVTEHWTIYHNDATDAYEHKNYLFKFYTKKIIHNADLFLPVSNNLGKSIQQKIGNTSFCTVPNVADTSIFKYAISDITKEKKFSFVHVSTLNYQKNPEAILRAYKSFQQKYPSSNLIIVGEAPNNLKQYAISLEISTENIVFTGLVSYPEVASILQKSEALVMFSRYENLPCVIIEALCCGLPVISTNVGGIGEIVNESNGILINKEDEKGLLNAMVEIFENYKKFHREAISENAVNIFSYKKIGEKITGIYKEILNQKVE